MAYRVHGPSGKPQVTFRCQHISFLDSPLESMTDDVTSVSSLKLRVVQVSETFVKSDKQWGLTGVTSSFLGSCSPRRFPFSVLSLSNLDYFAFWYGDV